MSNERKASELISKSLTADLAAGEQAEVDLHLSENKDTSSFATLSRLIHNSVADLAMAAEAGDPTVAPGLSEDAKQRLKKSVRAAKDATHAPTNTGSLFRPEDIVAVGDQRRAGVRFTLIRKIGEGGLGTVWLARDEELKRNVAIKEMHPQTAESPKHFQRFHREAAVTGLLEHPNVVPLHMFGMNTQTGQPFYAMRFLGKQTLADAIVEYHERRIAGQTESIDLHRLLTAFLDVCQAIAYAHSRGVVHRDLKPENVALDNFGQVIVLDWGIAKLMSDGELAIQCAMTPGCLDDELLTGTVDGEVVGTPLYMAPEQAAGRLDEIDQRTDVYGLGSILFAILTGVAPHEKSRVETGERDVTAFLKVISQREAPKPREYNHNVPIDLEAICIKAMSPRRFTRHATALDLANDVERWMAGQHEKRKTYDAIRLEGRDLRSNLTSCIRDFSTNVRFMSTLPPIQGLIDAAISQDQEDATVWRERLSTIFRGLLRANLDFTAITYSRVLDGQQIELVRAERPAHDMAIRTVPKSRLTSEDLDAFANSVMLEKPDDVFVAINCLPQAARARGEQLKIEAGVPIFDREEEPFGLVTVEGDFARLVAARLRTSNKTSAQVMVVDDCDCVLLHEGEGQFLAGAPASDVLSNWKEIKSDLDRSGDFIDGAKEVFATRVELVPRVSSLTLVLRSGSKT